MSPKPPHICMKMNYENKLKSDFKKRAIQDDEFTLIRQEDLSMPNLVKEESPFINETLWGSHYKSQDLINVTVTLK